MKYTLHGVEIADPYRWLEDLDSPQTRHWIEQQNQQTGRFLDGIPERDRIRARLTELWNYERWTTPVKRGGRYFFQKNDGLQNQAVLVMSERLDGAARQLIDPNTLSQDGTVALTMFQPSPDGRRVAYGVAASGSDWEEWRVLDVESGRNTGDHLRWVKFSTTAWTADNEGFFYCRYDEPRDEDAFQGANYFHKVFYHRLGTPQDQDVLVFHRPDEKKWVFGPEVSHDGRFLIIHVWAGTGVENLVYYRDLHSDGAMTELISTFEARYVFAGNDGPVFWFHSDRNAPRGRVIAVDTRRPSIENHVELVPEGEDTLESLAVGGRYFVGRYLHHAHSRLRVFDLAGKPLWVFELPGLGSVTEFHCEQGESEAFYDFTTFTRPTAVYRCDLETGAVTTFHESPLRFNPDDYTTTQVFYTSRDGTRIPMFLSHKKDIRLDGNNPTELYGYGGFSIPLTPAYATGRLAWMEMGGVFAVANLRGGGEYGEDWHRAGTRRQKQNVFDDFIAAAEWLIANRYTSTPRLAISGRSNGGLLIGACMVQRPDLFGAALPGVGVMDMLRFHQFTIGWSWISDYGSPDNPDEFVALHAYSPYHNLKSGVRYPATLITTGDHDDRVVPAHSYKFAAALQEAQGGDAPILIRIDVRAGHGAGKPTQKQIDELTDTLGFMVRVLG